MLRKILGAVFLTLFFIGCQSVQQTGRSQFIVVSESQERQLGDDAYQDILKNPGYRLATSGKHSFPVSVSGSPL